MPIPTLATSDDVETVVEYLRTKPLGATLAEAKATLASKLLDPKRVSAYQQWGFVSFASDKLNLTTLGREIVQASEETKNEVFARVLKQEKIYYMTLEFMYHRNITLIPLEDVASHWVEHFSSDVATGSERTLKEQVTCFMSIASASGLGDYLIGRRGSQTRFEVNRDALEQFMLQTSEEDANVEDKHTDIQNNIEDISIKSQTHTSPELPPNNYGNSSITPSLHIDIQIHIDSDATADQIDQIFASMAKHLYNKDND